MHMRGARGGTDNTDLVAQTISHDLGIYELVERWHLLRRQLPPSRTAGSVPSGSDGGGDEAGTGNPGVRRDSGLNASVKKYLVVHGSGHFALGRL